MKKVLVFVGLIITLSGCSRDEFYIEKASVISKEMKIPIICHDGGCVNYTLTIEKDGVRKVINTNRVGYELSSVNSVVDIKCCSMLGQISTINLHKVKFVSEN